LDLPEPDGPATAVTVPARNVTSTPRSACASPVADRYTRTTPSHSTVTSPLTTDHHHLRPLASPRPRPVARRPAHSSPRSTSPAGTASARRRATAVATTAAPASTTTSTATSTHVTIGRTSGAR